MFKKDALMDNIAVMAGGAVGLVSGMRRHLRDDLKSRTGEVARKLDLAHQKQIRRLEHLVLQSQETIKTLEKRIEILENEQKNVGGRSGK